MSYTVQSLYLPHWFRRHRGLAISIAFSGVGAGAILLLPWWQTIIGEEGWRASCRLMGLMVLLILGPINLLVRHRPEEMGLHQDGRAPGATAADGRPAAIIADPAWAGVEWTLKRAMRTARFWWLAAAFFSALFAWYAVQVHQTAYLIEVGFSAAVAGWALGLVSAVGIPGQIGFGALSDRIGREGAWTIGCAGFLICYGALIALEGRPSTGLLYLMVIAQGFLGYAFPAVMGPIVAEIFEGPHYGAIFGMLSVALIGGGAAGPWITGLIHDAAGSYLPAFYLGIAFCLVSALAIWIAAPRKVRPVPGRAGRT
jgi:MFS family permease